MGTPLKTSNLILYFSLPFKKSGTISPFFNGHIGLSLDGMLYHIVNPHLLKSDFLFSIMPTQEWLFGSSRQWVDRDTASPNYRHVYLYRKNESTRTAVYSAGITVSQDIIWGHHRKRIITYVKRFDWITAFKIQIFPRL